jgi:hypothetical protein
MGSEAVHNDEADHNDEEASCLDDEACLDADGDHSEVVVAVHDYTVDHDSMEVVDLDREGQGQAHAVPFGKERVVPFREEVQEQSRHEGIGTLLLLLMLVLVMMLLLLLLLFGRMLLLYSLTAHC